MPVCHSHPSPRRAALAAIAAGTAALIAGRRPVLAADSIGPAEDAKPVARIGHAHLHVRTLERSVAFYRDLLGMQVTETVGGRISFLSAGHHHHDLALQAIGADAPAQPGRTPGLYHVAFEASNAAEFGRFWDRLGPMGIRPAAVDHGISWALYFDDPDGNGVEIYVDRRSSPGGTAMWGGRTTRLDRRRVDD